MKGSIRIEQLRAYCLSKKGSTAGYPFGEGTLVFKVGGKMFALVAEDEDPLRLNLKCHPADALALRAQYENVLPGYHMNKKHWNTLVLDATFPVALMQELVNHSYELVVQSLSRAEREKLGA